MTLREMFRPHTKYWDCYNDEPLKYDHENKCVKIADKFAIGFAEWVLDRFTFKDFIHKEPKELLEIYKKQKKL